MLDVDRGMLVDSAQTVPENNACSSLVQDEDGQALGSVKNMKQYQWQSETSAGEFEREPATLRFLGVPRSLLVSIPALATHYEVCRLGPFQLERGSMRHSISSQKMGFPSLRFSEIMQN